MSEHRLDQVFKQRLGDGSMQVPKDMWEGLEPFLPDADRRRRRGIVWITGIGVLLVAMAMSWWLLASDADPSSSASTPSVIAAGDNKEESIETIDYTSDRLNNAEVTNEEATTTQTVYPPTKSIATNSMQRSSPTAQTGEFSSRPVVMTEGNPKDAGTDNSSVLNTQINYPSNYLATSIQMLSGFTRTLPDPAKDCYSFGRKSHGGNGAWFAEVYAGPTISLRSLSSRNEDVSVYIAARDSTESSRLSWHAGIRLGYLHPSGITMRVGGHYTLVNELFDYFDGSSMGVTISFDTIRDAGGNIISIDSDTVIVSGQRIKTTHNRFHTIDIPFLLGYQFTNGHWSYGIHAGPVLNVAFIKKGDILSPAGDPVSISNNASMPYPAFEDHLGLSVFASMHIGKRIGQRTTIFAEPHIHHRLRAITLDAYPIDQRQTNIGLSLGLRLALN